MIPLYLMIPGLGRTGFGRDETCPDTIDHYWLVVSTHLKNMKVSWDDDIPNSNGKIIQSCSSHHQPDY